MKVLLCGAQDLHEVSKSFEKVVTTLGGFPMHFENATITYSNYRNWIQNSKEAIKDADIVVFVLIEDYGEITWTTEYLEAIKLGKPFILFCKTEIQSLYYRLKKNSNLAVKENTNEEKIYNVLRALEMEQKTIVPFDDREMFEGQLHQHIIVNLDQALQLLKKDNEKQSIIRLLELGNVEKIKSLKTSEFEKNYIRTILMDVFAHKELRKRVLIFFTVHKILSDDDIIQLLNDTEQGIGRKTMELLPQLVSVDNNIDEIFHSISSFIEDKDTSMIRKIIPAFFKIDIRKAIYLFREFFPAHDIGTPKRILKWLIENFNRYSEELVNKDFLEEFESFIYQCLNYSKGEKLEELHATLLNMINASVKRI